MAFSSIIEGKVEKPWFNLLSPLIDDSRFGTILQTLHKEKGKYEPGFNKIFRAFEVTPFDRLKVVIVGQDPYPQKGVATGIAFANEPGLSWSPSLNIIADELQESIPEFNEWLFIDNIDLLHWCRQGVLLLNSAFTVATGVPGSHADMWRFFTSDLIKALSLLPRPIVFVFMGKVAEDFAQYVEPSRLNAVLLCPHPAADTYDRSKFLFRTSNIFLRINEKLIEFNNPIIKWDEFKS